MELRIEDTGLSWRWGYRRQVRDEQEDKGTGT
jgi:hypothetical protein